MSAIIAVLLVKIAITILFLAGPFLFLSQQKLERLTAIQAQSTTFFRLYGMAMAALLVAYISGMWEASQGVFPWGIVAMGIVSNGGATIILLMTGDRRSKRVVAPIFGSIALGLLACSAFPDAALTPLFQITSGEQI